MGNIKKFSEYSINENEQNGQLGFDVEPQDIIVKAWVGLRRDEDGTQEYNLYNSKSAALKGEQMSNWDEGNHFIFETDFRMGHSNGEWWIHKGNLSDGGWDYGADEEAEANRQRINDQNFD